MSDADRILKVRVTAHHRERDRLFATILILQWLFAIVVALVASPWTWTGSSRTLHVHVSAALALGGVMNALPLYLIHRRPGWWGTRHAIAMVQMMWSALLITITNGRIETHFHVFVSLAFLATYRDWRVLVTATVVILIDHLARGLWWPDSIYGIANPEWWRFAEHAAWIGFEDVVLATSCAHALAAMGQAAAREAQLAEANERVELKVIERTRQLETETAERMRIEVELRQAQRLESVGRLAAGIAHELNTPIQYVSDSCEFVKEATADLQAVFDEYRALLDASARGTITPATALATARAADERADAVALGQAVGESAETALEGLRRIASIVRAMKEFAYPDRTEQTAIDLNRAVESTLAVARHEYKYVAEVHTQLGELPLVRCHIGDVNQALLNMLINAAHAIEAQPAAARRAEIFVTTEARERDVAISVRDNGVGIPPEVIDKIFDPFFTTKPLGKGTGQGLAIARSAIVEKHGGQLTVTSEVGLGTTFTISLPIAGHSPTA